MNCANQVGHLLNNLELVDSVHASYISFEYAFVKEWNSKQCDVPGTMDKTI